MNLLWPFLICFSLIYSIFNGSINNVNNSIYNSSLNVINLIMVLLGNMCLWCGIINVLKNTKLMNILEKVLNPIIKWIFPNEAKNKDILDKISINMISNFLGIGNAATPAGLSAMEKMQENNKNKSKLTDSMIMLIVINTTSIQLIPTTVLAIRSNLGSKNPSSIIGVIWISTFLGALTGIIVTKIMLKIRRNKDD